MKKYAKRAGIFDSKEEDDDERVFRMQEILCLLKYSPSRRDGFLTSEFEEIKSVNI